MGVSLSCFAAELVGPLADPISGWVVVADPNFAIASGGDSATYLPGGAPNDLGVVPALPAAGIGAVAVVAHFRSPIADYLGRGCVTSGNLEEIFTETRIGTVIELAIV